MIHVNQLHFTYSSPLPGQPDVVVFESLSFHVSPGEVVTVMGGNSSGKSTLCLALAGLAPRLTGGGKIAGEILIAGQDVQALPPGALAGTIGVVFQDPTGQLFNTTVEAEVAWGLENLGLPPAVIAERVAWALDVVRLEAPLDRPPEHLSGGQQKRLALAAVLALQPSVLLIDSLTGGLDPQGRREVIQTLRDLVDHDGYTILFTENDAEVVAMLAGRVLALHEGRLAMDGPPAEVFREVERLAEMGIAAPPAAQLAHHLQQAGRPAEFYTLAGALSALGRQP
jgi:energy-coupling factor transporter ATP-binding protein EcfA2